MSRLTLLRGILETARISVPTLVDSLLGRIDMKVCDERVVAWSKRLLEQGGLRLEISGREHLDTDETFVVMSNHQSLYDIPILFVVFEGKTLRMVTKAELFRIPIWGPAMRGAGFISVDRRNPQRAIASLERAKTELERGIDIWIAPEGTRSRTGVLGPFKKGGFHLALDTGKRILPVTILGSGEALHAGSLDIRRGTNVKVFVSPPIDPKTYGAERRNDLRDEVRRAIAARLPSERRGNADPSDAR